MQLLLFILYASVLLVTMRILSAIRLELYIHCLTMKLTNLFFVFI